MNNPKIKLGGEVMVSDPCYTVGTWCQKKLTNVLPGEYNTIAYSTDNTGGWGNRVAALIAVHKDYLEDDLKWRTDNSADIGVDSGQCGIFSMESYRNDDIFKNEVSEFAKKYFSKEELGEHWYSHMCDRTLSEQSWGTYENGVVSSSGIGDGSYRLLLAKHNGKIVGIAVDYYILELKSDSFNEIISAELV